MIDHASSVEGVDRALVPAGATAVVLYKTNRSVLLYPRDGWNNVFPILPAAKSTSGQAEACLYPLGVSPLSPSSRRPMAPKYIFYSAGILLLSPFTP